MRRFILVLPVLIFCSQIAYTQSYDFKIMAWNVKWFGDPSYCNCDTALQNQNVSTVLQVENPDIVALQEIQDVRKIRSLAEKLGYNCTIAPYGSLSPDSTSGYYPSAQKLVYLYKKGNIRMIENYGLTRSTFPLYSNNNSPYYYFASGRFPYLASFELYDSGVSDTLTLINMHAKSGGGLSNYNRRQKGAIVMQDSLDKKYPNRKVLVLGDFNDLLEASIVSSQISPYQYNIDKGYIPLTSPSDFPGQKTYIYGSGDIIDNFMSSPSFNQQIKPSSIEILSRVSNYVTSFASTTSDHYPIALKYTSTVPNLLSATYPIDTERLHYRLESQKIIVEQDYGQTYLKLHDMLGRVVFEKNINQSYSEIDVSHLESQVYLLTITYKEHLLHSSTLFL